MKARLYYRQVTRLNHWHFYFGDEFTNEQFTRAFRSLDEARNFANNNNIDYNEDDMVSIFV